MKKGNAQGMMILIVAACAAAILFAACSKENGNNAQETAAAGTSAGNAAGSVAGAAAETTTEAAEHEKLPEGVTLVGLKFAQWGMRMDSNYSIRQTPDGYECCITNGEIFWPAMDGEELIEDGTYKYDEDKGYGYDSFLGGDPLAEDGPMFSRVLVGEQEMKALQDALLAENILAWDGYDEKWEPPLGMEVTDTGETFDLKLLFSDGRLLKAHGVDIEPDNFNQVYTIIRDFFEEHQDYSRYYPTDLPEEPISSMIVKFYDPHHFQGTPAWILELHAAWDNQWTVSARDPQGEFLEAGTDISDYDRLGEKKLPFDRFYKILQKYDLGSWNQAQGRDPDGGDEYWQVNIFYEDGRMYRVDTNRKPDKYDAFREEMIREIISFYREVRL